MTKNCKVCSRYQCEEIGDSDYGAIYAKEPSCLQERDYDEENDCFIEGFDRDVERDCCVLDFFKVVISVGI